MKKITIIIAILAFLLNTVSGAANTTIGINNASTTPLNINHTLITLHNMSNFGAATIDFYFDPDVVNIMTASLGFNGYGGSLTFNMGTTGMARFVIVTTDIPGPNSPLTLLDVTLKAVGSGGQSSTLGLVVPTLADTDGNSFFPAVNNGTFTILSIPDLVKPSISSSGGGSGSTPGENFTNIEVKEKYTLFINKDITTSYLFKKTDPIISVNITGNRNASEINVAVEVLRNTSSLVKTPAPELVYKNVNIWVGTYGFATPTNIKHAEITFRVPVSWMRSNSIDPDTITMMHYQGAWEPLSTKKIGETSEWIYYEASTTRFSPIAITGKTSSGKSYNFVPQTAQITESKQTVINVSSAGNEINSPAKLDKILLIAAIIFILLNASPIYIRRKRK